MCASVPAVDPVITAAWIAAAVGAAGIAGTVVLAASAAAEDAHTQVQRKQYVLVLLTQQSPGVPFTQQHGEAVQRAAETFNAAIDAGRAAEDALIEVIRAELRAGPEAATLPATVPPEHRRIWHRQRG
jgi:hypothetical protein